MPETVANIAKYGKLKKLRKLHMLYRWDPPDLNDWDETGLVLGKENLLPWAELIRRSGCADFQNLRTEAKDMGFPREVQWEESERRWRQVACEAF